MSCALDLLWLRVDRIAARRWLEGPGPWTSTALGHAVAERCRCDADRADASEGIRETDVNRLKHDSRDPRIHWMYGISNIEFELNSIL